LTPPILKRGYAPAKYRSTVDRYRAASPPTTIIIQKLRLLRLAGMNTPEVT